MGQVDTVQGAHVGQADAREGLTWAGAELLPQVSACALRRLPSRVSESSHGPTSGWSCVISVPPRRHHKPRAMGPIFILHTRKQAWQGRVTRAGCVLRAGGSTYANAGLVRLL